MTEKALHVLRSALEAETISKGDLVEKIEEAVALLSPKPSRATTPPPPKKEHFPEPTKKRI